MGRPRWVHYGRPGRGRRFPFGPPTQTDEKRTKYGPFGRRVGVALRDPSNTALHPCFKRNKSHICEESDAAYMDKAATKLTRHAPLTKNISQLRRFAANLG